MAYYGYHRISTKEQHLDRGIIEIKRFCENQKIKLESIFTDKITGKNFDRPRYTVLVEDVLRVGDTLIITELDRLGRNKQEILKQLRFLEEKGVRVMVLELPTTLFDLSQMENNLAKMMIETINNMMIELYASMAQATPENIRKFHPNLIVNATGSGPLLPPIKGLMDNIDKEGGNVYSILGMINHINDFPEDLEGKKIAVIGGGAVGLDVVEFFAARKADISIVEMMDQIGRDLDPVTKNDMKCQMKTHGVHQLTQTALLEVKEHSFLVKGSDGSYELPFDYGFVCLGMRAKGQLYPQLLDAFADDDVEILNIGDSQRARRIIDGTMEGRNILYHLTQRGYLD